MSHVGLKRPSLSHVGLFSYKNADFGENAYDLCVFCWVGWRGVLGRGVRGEGKPSPRIGSKDGVTPKGVSGFWSPSGSLLGALWESLGSLERTWSAPWSPLGTIFRSLACLDPPKVVKTIVFLRLFIECT